MGARSESQSDRITAQGAEGRVHGIFRSLAASIVGAMKAHGERRRNAHSLRTMNAHLLRDIGLSRMELEAQRLARKASATAGLPPAARVHRLEVRRAAPGEVDLDRAA